MKYLYILSAILLFSLSAQAQITIYHEDFSGTVQGVTTLNNTWGLSSQAPTSNTTLSSGGAHYRTSTTIASGYTTKTLYLDNSINTIGFKDIKVTWVDLYAQIKGNVSSNNVRFFYSVNGGSYTEVTGLTHNQYYNQWARINGGAAISLPASCNDARSIRFFWSVVNDNKHGDYYAIDDISISGTPDDDQTTAEADLSVLDWSKIALNEDPFAAGKTYAVDGNKVTFTKASAAGVTITKSVVSNSDFQNPTNTLTLTQTKASSTLGTKVTMTFAEPVADLTFTIFDVDQASNQFQDKLVIKGMGFSGPLSLTKTKVKTTANNSFNLGSSTITGVSGTDVAANSSGGNITVTFSDYVGEVTIEYYNSDAVRNNAGQQGIGIHNLYWRRDRSIITLPVELMAFKGAVQNGNAKLNWATAQETANDKFVVERSQDGKSFTKVGEVKGHGNSSTRLDYSFTDTNPTVGANYYRLRQVDFDGTEAFSNVVALEFQQKQSTAAAGIASVYPTVASVEVNISLAVDKAQVSLVDMKGRTLGQYTAEGRNMVLPVAGLQPGVYFVTVTDGAQRHTQRFIKQ
ncbi:T9SS type A sorting domain-containing protein [Pontibacter rugosus]|uniref:T9SS type A sorting domain-containing protein n=1 Tax=Pontibacter rugosus TaxID=1745966 RepID=A0ABW3SUM4_9BACT